MPQYNTVPLATRRILTKMELIEIILLVDQSNAKLLSLPSMKHTSAFYCTRSCTHAHSQHVLLPCLTFHLFPIQLSCFKNFNSIVLVLTER